MSWSVCWIKSTQTTLSNLGLALTVPLPCALEFQWPSCLAELSLTKTVQVDLNLANKPYIEVRHAICLSIENNLCRYSKVFLQFLCLFPHHLKCSFFPFPEMCNRLVSTNNKYKRRYVLFCKQIIKGCKVQSSETNQGLALRRTSTLIQPQMSVLFGNGTF